MQIRTATDQDAALKEQLLEAKRSHIAESQTAEQRCAIIGGICSQTIVSCGFFFSFFLLSLYRIAEAEDKTRQAARELEVTRQQLQDLKAQLERQAQLD